MKIERKKLEGTTRIVAVIHEPGLEEMAALAKDSGAHILEVRADLFPPAYLSSLGRSLRVLRKLRLPLIGTVRRKDEGGGRKLAEKERLQILRKMLPLVDAVDIELRSKTILPDVVKMTKAKGKLVIISYHNMVETPPDVVLEKIASRAKDEGADIIKIATMAKRREDVARLLIFTLVFPYKPMVVISMGRLGSMSRIIGPLFGSCFTYGHVGKPVAPGQMEISHLKEELRRCDIN